MQSTKRLCGPQEGQVVPSEGSRGPKVAVLTFDGQHGAQNMKDSSCLFIYSVSLSGVASLQRAWILEDMVYWSKVSHLSDI